MCGADGYAARPRAQRHPQRQGDQLARAQARFVRQDEHRPVEPCGNLVDEARELRILKPCGPVRGRLRELRQALDRVARD